MYQLFAFQQSVEAETCEPPSGHYDAEQQVWIADEISVARDDSAPIASQTRFITRGKVTFRPDGSHDLEADYGIDF